MRLAFAIAVLLLLAPAAAADIGIVSITPKVAPPGQRVRVHIDGYLPMHSASMPIVLVRAELMPTPYPCQGGTAICEPAVWRGRLERPPYLILGFARHWQRNTQLPDHVDAWLNARLPKLASGRYRIALWCAACIRGAQGALIAGPTLTIHSS